jgi:YjbE family integral membrane protein
MELFSVSWWSALATIVLVDLVLAGDNALVIGMAAQRLPIALRRRAILWGALGAIAVRGVLALGVVWLMQLPGLLLVGGLLLVPIAWRMAVPAPAAHGASHRPADTFWGALRTIVVADALMGLDNVLAIGGAAHGRWELVLIGLLITVPLVLWGSGWVVRAAERWPSTRAIGAAVLAATAAGMIAGDPVFDRLVPALAALDGLLKLLAAAVLLLVGLVSVRRTSGLTAAPEDGLGSRGRS